MFSPNQPESPLLEAYHGRYGCDTPPSMMLAILNSALKTTPEREAFIVTGDLTAHYWLPAHDHLRFLTAAVSSGILRLLVEHGPLEVNVKDWSGDSIDFLRAIAAANTQRHSTRTDTPRGSVDSPHAFFKATFPPGGGKAVAKAVPVVMSVGNNDLEGDYVIEENSEWNADLYELWKGWVVPEDARDQFIRGLYYRKSLPGSPLDFIVINSVWYHHLAVDGQGIPITEKYANLVDPDPAGQFAWLESELERAEREHRQVIIVGHVPPAKSLFRNTYLGFTVDAEWSCIWAKRYESILDGYRHRIKGQYFGHIHTDEFRIELGDRAASNSTVGAGGEVAKGLILIAPSVAPNHANNPSWRKMLFRFTSQGEFQLQKYEQHYAALYGYQAGDHREYFGTFDRSQLLRVDQIHDTTHTIGPLKQLSPRSVYREVTEYILRSQKRTTKWWQNQLVFGGGGPPAFVIRCILLEHYERHHDVRRCVRDTVSAGVQPDVIAVEE